MEAKTITILNRLNRKDSSTGLDIWYKTKLNNIQYSIQAVTNVNGSTVSMGQMYVILIPFSGLYLPYKQWSQSVNKDKYFTMNQGDIIILGDVDDNITPNNVQAIKQAYVPNSCEVRTIVEVPHKHGANIQLRVSGV